MGRPYLETYKTNMSTETSLCSYDTSGPLAIVAREISVPLITIVVRTEYKLKCFLKAQIC